MPRILQRLTPLMAALLVVSMSPISYGKEAGPTGSRTKKAAYGAIPHWVPGMPPCEAVERPRAATPNCVLLDTKKAERYVSLEITDRSGLPVAGYILKRSPQLSDYALGFRGITPFCGRTHSPVAIKGGRPIIVYLNIGEPYFPLHCRPGLATVGTVQATFLRGDPR